MEPAGPTRKRSPINRRACSWLTAEHHDHFEKTHLEHHWWDWYAAYLSARQNGSSSEQAGAAADRHLEEIIYVIEGTLEYEIGGKKSTVKTGDVLFVPAGTPHTVTNIGSGNGAELATYVVEKGKPLITLVK